MPATDDGLESMLEEFNGSAVQYGFAKVEVSFDVFSFFFFSC